MVEEYRDILDKEITNMIKELYENYFRKMQGEMHRCSAVCYDQKTLSLDNLQECLNKCSVKISKALSYVETHVANFDDKLQNCVLQCRVDVGTKAGINPTEAEMEKLMKIFENCAVNCLIKQIEYLPTLQKNIIADLSKL